MTKFIQQESEKELISPQYINSIFEQSTTVVFVWKDVVDRLPAYVSNNSEQVLSYKATELMSKDFVFDNIIHSNERQKITDELLLFSNNKDDNFKQLSYSIIQKDGKLCVIDEKLYKKINLDGETTHYEGIVNDITPLNKTLDELHKTKKSFEDMIYIASHDLQSPLVSIEGFLYRITKIYQDKLDSEMLRMLGRIKVNSGRMKTLLQSLLDISRLNTHKNLFRTFDINGLINEIKVDLASLIEENNARLVIEKMPPIYGDRHRMHSVYEHIIANAIIFGGSEIKIGYADKKYYIQDNGIGIKKSQLEKIFVPGTQLKEVNYDGVGMGLAFCKKVIELHKGKIWAESDENTGTTFYLSLSVDFS